MFPSYGGYGLMDALEGDLWRKLANDPDLLEKSLLSPQGIVSAGATDGSALKVQLLHGALERMSYEQDSAQAMKRIPKKKVYSNTFEWSILTQYGGPGDGFVAESGESTAQSSGLFFGVSGADDSFLRKVMSLKYMAAVRTVSLVSQLVKNIEDAMTVSEKAATLELIGKANSAIYWGDSKTHSLQFDGIVRQVTDWVSSFPQDQGILFDAGGQPIDKAMLEDISVTAIQKYASPSLLLESPVAFGDTQKMLFPEARFQEGTGGGFGGQRDRFMSPYGPIKLAYDPLLRVNKPLELEGTGVTGKPRATDQTGASAWSATPWGTVPAAESAGTGDFWKNVDTFGAALASSPKTPTGEGNQGNRLAAGSYYYAVSAVVNGRESKAWVYGAASAGVVTSASAISPTAGQIVKVTIDNTKVTGISSSNASSTKFRVYRATVANSLNDFDLLCEVGAVAATGNSIGYDNGFNIPGSDNAFLLTEQKNGADGWCLLQLLPLMKRMGLPEYILGSPIALLLFAAVLLIVPRHHVWIRNIGRAS